MFSDTIKSSLEAEVVGQPRAVNSVVRGVTRAVSALVPREGTPCAYMFMGPTGTGKTHLVRSLARTLHGDERQLAVADCTHFAAGDPWMGFVAQLMPLFAPTPLGAKWSVLEPPRLSIILIEYLERGPKEVAAAIAAALETGHLALPEGLRGSLRNCLVFITSSLCAREILAESPRIGFSGGQDEDEDPIETDRVYKTCLERAEEKFGTDLMGRLDGLVLFHRLQEEHLAEILERLVENLNHWLELRAFRCELRQPAKAFLLERGRRDLRLGSRDLVRAFRRFVEFPVADLAVSGRIPSGGLVLADRVSGEDHLHFTVTRRPAAGAEASPWPAAQDVPVVWGRARAAP